MSADIAALVSENLDIWTTAVERKANTGRGPGKRSGLYGIERLRALILDLAVRGKLVPQDSDDDTVSETLSQISKEHAQRLATGELRNSKPPVRLEVEPFSLPPNWRWIPLGQTGNIFSGNSINESVRAELQEVTEGDPFVATKDIGYGLDRIDYENGLMVKPGDKRFVIARPNTVFICAEGGSAGKKIAICDRNVAFGNKLIANEPWSPIESKFLLYVYMSDVFYSWFSAEMTGIIGGISRARFLSLPFPLPPLAEQQRIIAKLDELMGLCDVLEEHSGSALDAHQELVETLLVALVSSTDAADLADGWARLEGHFNTLFATRASVEALKQTIRLLAIKGKLSRPEDGDEAASVLLDRIKEWQAAAVAKKEIRLPRKPLNPVGVDEQPYPCPANWKWVRLGEIIYIRSGDGLTAAQMIDGVIPVYGGNGVNGFHNAQNVSQKTIVIGRVGFYCGSIHVTPDAAWVTDNAFITHFSREDIYLDFLRLLLISTNLKEDENATAQPVISGSKIYPIVVGLPPLAEQKRIVSKVDELMAICDALESSIMGAVQTQEQLADTVLDCAAA